MRGRAVPQAVPPGQVVDLFSGAGGFSRGFAAEGFGITHAVEVQRAHAAAFAANFPDAKVLNDDIRQVPGLGTRPDVLVGGPPCEAFTGANARREPDPKRRLYGDPRGSLVLEFVRLAEMLRPRVVVMENVVGVADGPLREALRDEFRRAGFPTLFFNVLRAEEHGVASRRERLFLSNLPLQPKPAPREVTVGEALHGLPPPGPPSPPSSPSSAAPPGPANHEPVALSPEKQRQVARLRPGQSLVRFRSASGRGLANWMRLWPDQVAPPVMGRTRLVHPGEARVLTVREQARLMGYPDDHVFAGGRDAQFDQVGESVPPPLAAAIAREVRAYLDATRR